MADYFVRRKGAVGGSDSAQMWFDTVEDPKASIEHGKSITMRVAITDELRKEHEDYKTNFQNDGAGYHRASPNNHFPLDFFEWLQAKFPSEG